ncbi:helix-turn-helix domain-containing protein [Erwinia amylovora]|uniref:helix-turn-helix domain-containing protein n=1 Tax=Erwinia amylovora TaxID=552 RepID=UPI000C07E598|nr:helix-turn-helix domain-containing protein [Erwinia amylovora]
MKWVLDSRIAHYRPGLKVDADSLSSKNTVVIDDMLEINHNLVFANPLAKDSMLRFQVADGNIYDLPVLKQSVLIASLKILKLDVVGPWDIEILPIQKVATLLSFIDYHFGSADYFFKKESVNEDSLTLFDNNFLNISLTEGCHKRFMNVLTSAVLNRREQNLESIAPFIRKLESYWLAYFLLSQAMSGRSEDNNLNVYNVCKAYGVSESQFRKLCHHVFSRGPKKQLCMWRAAHSALQLIENDKPIAVVADMNGYASSSHFASELKSLFGITPREFKKIEGFLDEEARSGKN